MLNGSMPGNQIQADLHTALMRFLTQIAHIFVCSVSGGNTTKIGDIVASVPKGRLEDGVEPDRIASNGMNIVKLGNQTYQVSVAIVIGVAETLRVYLIEHGRLEPRRTGWYCQRQCRKFG